MTELLPPSEAAFLKYFMRRFEENARRRAQPARGIEAGDLLSPQHEAAIVLYRLWTSAQNAPEDWPAVVLAAASASLRRELRRHLGWSSRTVELAEHHLDSIVEDAREAEDDPLEFLADAIQATAAAVAIDAVQGDPDAENARVIIDVAIRRLSSERQRQVIRAIYLEQTPRNRLAEKLGLHPSTIGRIEKEALLEMKETLQTVVSREVESSERSGGSHGG